ncbi:LacI family DNA-binding transcriptional regulator [uncultured Ruegeria sp.]|uniref:LacI family DNA-binding transcriptional regulator n=1 Tax=uncultured Ruegeria sp. TaxID=259304 RepID=UPI00262D73B7|nr:LacI family DNA-binding transcriptional regulator [uncultured Ruegeria sp.]
MTKKPTLSSVAKEAGVSVPTVSQVMRDTGRISEKTRQKVLSAAKRLRYVPNQAAATMRSGDNREIGFIINKLANPFNAEVVSGAVDLLETEGFMVSVLDAQGDLQRQDRLLEACIRFGRRGLIWVPALDTNEDAMELLEAHGVPAVTFMRKVSQSLDHVGVLNTEALTQATQHLIDFGHKHIAYFGGIEQTSVREERIAGYLSACEKLDGVRPIIWPCEETKRAGFDAVAALRHKHPEVTGIVCNGDVVALGACFGLIQSGLKPGRDFSVVGFDDIEDAAVSMPGLTTMAIDPKKLGKRLAEILLDRMRTPELPVRHFEYSATLITRGTSGEAPDS